MNRALMHLRRLITQPAIVGLTWLLVAESATSQSVSPIGKYLEPWGALEDASAIAMTPDGQTIAFVESTGAACAFTFQRISLIRPDGTGYRVVVDWPVLFALQAQPSLTAIMQLRISGDGKWLSFWWPHAYDSSDCTLLGPAHTFLVDVDTGAVSEFVFNGMPVVPFVSFTDDGQTLAFAGFDPASGTYLYYLAGPDGSGAVPFLNPSQWPLGSFGAISGDGKKFVVVGTVGGYPYPSEVHVLDIATGALQKVSATPQDDITGAAISRDGSRVVYAGYGKSLYAVNGDGTDHHLVFSNGTQGSATITRDGEYVFFTAWNGVGARDYRVGWDGTGLVEINGWNLGYWNMSHQPVDGSGSMLAMMAPAFGGAVPMAVWFAEPPMLTTYGYAEPGTTLTWDVGGAPPEPVLLLYAWDAASLPLKTWGTLELAPRSLHILWHGAVSPPWNTASMSLTIPANLDLPAPLDVYSQAIVFGAQATKLTNSTVITLQPLGSSLGVQAGGSGGARPRGPGARDVHGPMALDPVSAQRRRELVGIGSMPRSQVHPDIQRR